MSGQLFIVTAPSGAGKTTLVNGLLRLDAAVRVSVSHTTRAPRPGEQDGRDYHFVAPRDFEAMRQAGAFLESAQVHGNSYGTARRNLEDEFGRGHDVVLEIDWQGARQVRTAYPQSIGVFVLPPSIEVLERRLRARGADSETVIARRLGAAREEIAHVGEFDYVIINNELQEALNDLAAIVRASRCRRGACWDALRAHYGSLIEEH